MSRLLARRTLRALVQEASSLNCQGTLPALQILSTSTGHVSLFCNKGLQQPQQFRHKSTAVQAHALSDDDDISLAEQQRQEAGALLRNTCIGVIGAGQMATAMIRGWFAAGISSPQRICTSDRPEAQRLLKSYGITTFGEAGNGGAQQVAASSDIIFLCVKPQNMGEVLEALSPHLDARRHLIVSIAAGITLDTYEGALPAGARVIRVMPNTPLLVGQGAACYCLGSSATPEDEAQLRALLAASGLVLSVPEHKMDAVTALSGSGPAFVYLMIESLADGGVMSGLARDQALQLAAQTVYGSAAMVLQAAGDPGALMHPAVLKDRVASPAGTTIAGLNVLEQAGMRGAVMRAVAAAAQRSRELSKETQQ